MIGAHTDSPCLKLKPVTKSTKSGFLMLNIEPYGGGLWYTWFDRDLGLAGRVLVRTKAEGGSGDGAAAVRRKQEIVVVLAGRCRPLASEHTGGSFRAGRVLEDAHRCTLAASA